MKNILFAVTAAIALIGCSKQQSTTDTTATAPDSYIDPGHIEIRTGIPDVKVYKFVDMESRATCYIMDGYNSGGIYCIPYQNNNGQ